MLTLRLAWRQFLSLWFAGELNMLLAALALAVAATTTVSFFTDRVNSSLLTQGNILLGADLVLSSDHLIPDQYRDTAIARKLQVIETLEFPSMVIKDEKNQLAEIKAVEQGFPLRGDLSVSQSLHGLSKPASTIPAQGEVWIEPRLATALQLNVGDVLELGQSTFKVGAILQRETSRGGDMFSIAPRLLMNKLDVAATGLIQYGSRINYQLMIAADLPEIKTYASWLKPLLQRGEKVQDVSNARPEMRVALEKSEQFLGLAALVGVILSMVAIYLASLPFMEKSLDTFALMRCFGASSNTIHLILITQTLLIGLVGSSLGCVLAYVAQAGLAKLAGTLFLQSLPPPSLLPLFFGLVTGMAILLAAIWPALIQLRSVSALRVLRRDIGASNSNRYLLFAPALVVMALLIFWQAQSPKLALYTLLSLSALFVTISTLYYLLSKASKNIEAGKFHAWKLGIANLRRRNALGLIQVLGFSLGLMAMMLLALVRVDLLHNWQASLPDNAPNRFVINIQPEQIKPVATFFAEESMQKPEIFPMVRARLTAINHLPLDTSKYKDERAQRLAEREFNLSWASKMQSDNKLLAGSWWRDTDAGKPMLSLEQGLAETLNIKLGDTFTYDVAGKPLVLTVTSLRKVEWDSMRPNFFAVTPPGVLDTFPASFITSLYLPLGHEDVLNRLLKQFPNLTVIDIAALMQEVRGVMNKMIAAVSYVFGFTVLAGFAILYAALLASRDVRVREAALLRVLGASYQQLRMATLAEFFLVGILASLVAILIANLLAYVVSIKLLSIAYHFNMLLAIAMTVVAATLVPFAAWLSLRKLINLPPKTLLQSI